MANNVEEGSKSDFVLRFVNYSRILFYGIIGAIRLPLFILCFMSSGYCNAFVVLVPFVFIFLDAMIIRWRRNPFTYFLLVSLFVCVANIGAVYLTLLPIIFYLVIGWHIDLITSILSIGVGLISFVELMMLIYLTRPQEQRDEDVWNGETDTIGIQ